MNTTISNVFAEISEGMAVFDLQGKKIGKVKYVQMPSSATDLDLASFPYDLSRKEVATELAQGLLRFGFISVNAGWLAKDRVVVADQIESVNGGSVYLKALDENLITI